MKKNIKRQLKKKNKAHINWIWVIKLIILSFTISVLFSLLSETVIPNVNIVIGIVVTLFFVTIGVIFDMIGVAVTAADEAIFHSMAAKRERGAKLAVRFKKNADKVSSFCQDVIGDICGIVSGATGTVISIKIIEQFHTNNLFTALLIMGIISSLTIGGKAIEKGIAINKSNEILYRFSYFMSYFYRR